jgi:hypothetical protein
MATFNISVDITDPAGTIIVLLDSTTIVSGSGTASLPLTAGQSYVVQWYVDAAPGSDYMVRITSPGEARINLRRRLKGDGKDYGGFRFTA